MARIGMRYLVAAPISAETPGSAITYGTGFVVGPAVDANLTLEKEDNDDYGDDIIQESDQGVNGYNGTVECNDIPIENRAKLLGWVPVTSGTTESPTIDYYRITGADTPNHGFGFIQVHGKKTVLYDAYWFHKAKFSDSGVSAHTKQKGYEWGHKTLNIKGMGAYIDSSGEVSHWDCMEFSTEAAAKAWLNARAGITA